MLYRQRFVQAQVAPLTATIVTSYDYWDCDPQATGGATCSPKMKYVETRLGSVEYVLETTAVNEPAHPKQYLIRSREKMVRVYPEVNAHTTASMPGRGLVEGGPTPQTGCVPAHARMIGSGVLIGHPVVTYQQPGSATVSAALDLNCAPLRTVFHWNNGTPGQTSVTYKVATEAMAATPPSSIWAPPSTSAEMKPSQLMRKVWVGRFKSRGMSDAEALAAWHSRSAGDSQLSMMDAKWEREHGAK